MSVPHKVTYTSDDGVYSISIASAISEKGQISGSYTSSSSPVGSLQINNMRGSYMWVKSKAEGKSGVAPFVISFRAAQRPDSFAYSIVDSWHGGYNTGDTMLLTGTRSYVNEHGVVQSIGLGTKVFTS